MAAIVGSNQYGLDCELFTGKETAQRGETMVRPYAPTSTLYMRLDHATMRGSSLVPLTTEEEPLVAWAVRSRHKQWGCMGEGRDERMHGVGQQPNAW